jgi:hypothetical protein
MATVVRLVSEQEKGNYMPFDELGYSECRETYEAAGDYLAMGYELDGFLPETDDMLVQLNNDQEVLFYYGGHICTSATSEDKLL